MENIYAAFRRMYPSGKIGQYVICHDANGCMAEVRVYEDKGDPEQGFLANGFAYRPAGHSDYIEDALSAAAKCAVLAIGIDMEHNPDSHGKDDKPRTNSVKKKTASGSITPPSEEPSNNPADTAPFTPAVIVTIPGGSEDSVEDILKAMTREEAEAVEVPKGAGMEGIQTMKDVAIQRPASLKWYAEEYKGPDNRIPAAARLLLMRAYKPA